ncbi:zinc finger MYM-type protein 1-like [Photinus pyralis]|nr:zinc finger MYM-type protein 1-like [Photinus pyralis]XP_031359191.1 zinc finger MYM-type protein 1-like [Photinus pyralis]
MEQGDRHKGKRTYKSGAEKRKLAEIKEKSKADLIAKIPRITNFLRLSHPSTSQQHQHIQEHENSELITSQMKPDEEIELIEKGKGNVEIEQLQPPSVLNVSVDDDDDSVRNEIICNEYVNDIGLWPTNVSHLIDYWSKVGTSALQNCNDEIFKEKSFKQIVGSGANVNARRCQLSMFKRRSHNGEMIERSWLCFSPSNGRVYCFACKLLSSADTQFSRDGYCDWKHASSRLVAHEISKPHLNATIALVQRSKEMGRIDAELAREANNIKNYWQNLLKRLVSVIKFICERGLALRGDNELIGSRNNGNYLGLVELIAQYDDFLQQHLKTHANRGSGHTNYLSSTICEEVVQLMGKSVLDEIIFRIKKSKYYSISLDSTPDEGHVDQLTVTFRYIEGCTPVERFLYFMPNQGHKAQDMFDGLMQFLNTHGLDIRNCRGQSYDNASSMSGKYNGLQAKVMQENKLATWVPCAAHSLNLVAKAAAECCPAAVGFFDFLEELYVFFTGSTHRYNILVDSLKSVSDGFGEKTESRHSRIIIPKRVTTTRWACRSDACEALVKGYDQIKNALTQITDDAELTPKSRCDANGLFNRMCMLETGIYAVFWCEILDRTNATSQLLQQSKLDLNSAVAALKSLKQYVSMMRDKFSTYEVLGAEKSGTADYGHHRQRKRNVRLIPLDYGLTPEVELSPSEKFKIENYIPVIDQFTSGLTQRLTAYETICSRFAFLRHIEDLSREDLENNATNLVNTYSDDLEGNLGIELVQFAEFFKNFKDDTSVKCKPDSELSNEHLMYKILIENDLKVAFPNVEIALRIYLVLMVTNCTGERSFSDLKIIKNRLRTSMTQERLNSLAIMSMEYDILRGLKFDDVLASFALQKSRKVPGLI